MQATLPTVTITDFKVKGAFLGGSNFAIFVSLLLKSKKSVFWRGWGNGVLGKQTSFCYH